MDIVPLTLPINDPHLREEYARLIPKFFYPCLEGKDPFKLKSPVVGVGALMEGHPIGIALATANTKVHSAFIHLLMIEESYKEADLARTLLQLLTQLILSQGVTLATFTYVKEDSFSNILEKIFLENNWQGPRPFIIECVFKRADFDPSWWYKNIELQEGFEIFLFKTLTQQEQKDLLHRYDQKIIPNYIFPFGRETNLIEYKNSLGLRYNGKVIGWMITHRIEPDIIRYSALYLEDDFANSGYWLKLLIDALRIHVEGMHEVTYGLLEINLDQISTRWLKFIERRLFPQACKITHKQMFWKSFASMEKMET